jgi:hypothetical protein
MTAGHSRRASFTSVPVLMPNALASVAGGDRDGAVRQGLHDDDRLAAQRRVFLLFARIGAASVLMAASSLAPRLTDILRGD